MSVREVPKKKKDNINTEDRTDKQQASLLDVLI